MGVGEKVELTFPTIGVLDWITLLFKFLLILIDIIKVIYKVKSLCIVGYTDTIVFLRNPKIPLLQDPIFEPFRKIIILPPKLIVNIEDAKKVILRIKNIAEKEVYQIEKIRPEVACCIRWNVSIVRILKLWQLKTILKWLKYRKLFMRKHKLAGVDLYRIGILNWYKYVKDP